MDDADNGGVARKGECTQDMQWQKEMRSPAVQTEEQWKDGTGQIQMGSEQSVFGIEIVIRTETPWQNITVHNNSTMESYRSDHCR